MKKKYIKDKLRHQFGEPSISDDLFEARTGLKVKVEPMPTPVKPKPVLKWLTPALLVGALAIGVFVIYSDEIFKNANISNPQTDSLSETTATGSENDFESVPATTGDTGILMPNTLVANPLKANNKLKTLMIKDSKTYFSSETGNAIISPTLNFLLEGADILTSSNVETAYTELGFTNRNDFENKFNDFNKFLLQDNETINIKSQLYLALAGVSSKDNQLVNDLQTNNIHTLITATDKMANAVNQQLTSNTDTPIDVSDIITGDGVYMFANLKLFDQVKTENSGNQTQSKMTFNGKTSAKLTSFVHRQQIVKYGKDLATELEVVEFGIGSTMMKIVLPKVGSSLDDLDITNLPSITLTETAANLSVPQFKLEAKTKLALLARDYQTDRNLYSDLVVANNTNITATSINYFSFAASGINGHTNTTSENYSPAAEKMTIIVDRPFYAFVELDGMPLYHLKVNDIN